ncbi:MAG: hypothetical protein O2964_08295 [Verrucomicrobia bacterium]|jgi:hypothetical protein|nr:hypothetical protein [Verrucomicrobiota bacterium]
MKTKTKFQPGFRISAMDVGILVAGVMGASIVWSSSVLWALIILFVVAHFFMFCNIFRIPRRPELIWAGTFISLSFMTIVFELPGWLITAGTSFGLAAILIRQSMRRPDYHGVAWQKINPGLRDWWEERGTLKKPEDTHG